VSLDHFVEKDKRVMVEAVSDVVKGDTHSI
jgi:hypothetical protein